VSTSVSVEGRELIAAWTTINRGIIEWVLKLAEFDSSGAWAEDGYASCARWLSGTCEMGWSTAKEKLHVAHELKRRPLVRDAFEAGLPYSKVRLLVRLEGLDDERDAEFVAHALDDSIRMLDQRVKNWNFYNGREKPPPDIDDHYGIRRRPGFCGGMGQLVIEAPDDMLDRVMSLVDAYGEYLFHNPKPVDEAAMQPLDDEVQPVRPVDEAAMRPVDDEVRPVRPVDEAAMRPLDDEVQPVRPVDEAAMQPVDDDEVRPVRPVDEAAMQPEPPIERRSRSAKRLDWLLDLLEEAQLADPRKLDPYTAAVGVTIQYEDLINATGHGYTAQGSTLTGEAVRRLCCDAGISRVVVRGVSEIIDLGREERLFNRVQRRAIRFRHGHVCAVRGCGRRITQIHHIQWFEHDGETNIDNGVPVCSYHHHLVHDRGWHIEWDAARGRFQFIGPRGQHLESQARFQQAA
jgi:hypothetical protein